MSQVPPPPTIAPPPPAVDPGPGEKPATKWNGWDILMVLLTSLGFGGLAIAALLLVLAAVDVRLTTIATFGIASISIYVAVLISGWFFVMARRGASGADVGYRWVGVGPLLLALPVTIALMFATFVILEGIQTIVGGVPSGEEQLGITDSSLGAMDLVWLLLAGAVAAPIAEEFFFRGLFYPYLRSRWTVRTAVVVSSAVFALIHLTPLLMPALFVFGIVTALLVERYGSLYPSILLHAVNNGVLITAIYFSV